jgi:hypothetical protein
MMVMRLLSGLILFIDSVTGSVGVRALRVTNDFTVRLASSIDCVFKYRVHFFVMNFVPVLIFRVAHEHGISRVYENHREVA